MSKELLPPVVTTESTYTDIGADTPEGFSISSRSRSLAREMVGNATPEDRIRQRRSIAVGGWARADLLRLENELVTTGLAAGTPIFTDIQMLLTRIQKRGHFCPVACARDYGADIPGNRGSPAVRRGLLC